MRASMLNDDSPRNDWCSSGSGDALEIQSMRMRILSVCSQVAELSVFFAAAAVLAVGLMGLR